MPNEFNHNLDKITERELVPDIISRLTLGKPFEINVDSNIKLSVAEIGDNFQQILESIISTICDCQIMPNISKLKLKRINISSTDKEIYFYLDKSLTIIAVIPESLKYNIVNLFECDSTTSENENIYKLTLDTNYGITDHLYVYYRE